jgi:hypothetical protein
VGADQRAGYGVLTDFRARAGGGEVDGGGQMVYLCEFVDREEAVLSRDVIDGAYQDYEGLAL